MPQEVRADLLLGRDTLSPGLVKAGRAAADASGNISQLTRNLYEVSKQRATPVVDLQDKGASAKLDEVTARLAKLSAQVANPRVDVRDKDAQAQLAAMRVKLDTLGAKVSSPRVTLDGVTRVEAQLLAIDAQLDTLNHKTARPNVALSALSKLAGAGFFQPSALGTALSLLPAVIPLAAQATAGVGALAVSFGAAGAAAAAFGLMAGTVLTGASEDLAKLQALNTRLAVATTKAQKKAIEDQIKGLKSTWSKGYLDLIGIFQDFQAKWKKTSQDIVVPALTSWLQALTRGMQFLKPALEPVAALFTGLGQSLNAYFANNAEHVRAVAAAFGQFAATQLADVVRFILGVTRGFVSLGRALAANGANFSAAGSWLAGIGDGFATWAKSDAARKDVQGFMKFLHDTGPTVKGILTDLKDVLPGIFAGATTIGVLELKALGDFLHLIAGLPVGWQKGLTEFAGAMLLLSKIGVIKVGIQFTGALAALLSGGGIAGASLGGLTAAGAGWGAAIAGGLFLRLRQDLKAGASALVLDVPRFFGGIGGVVSASASGWADEIANHFEKPVRAGWAALGRYLADSARQTWHAIMGSLHALAGDARATWDLIWRNTVSRVRNGISDVTGWFRSLTGRVIGALFGLGHQLYAFGHAALNDFLSGFKSVAGSVFSWVGNFVHNIWSKVKNFFKVSSPSALFYDIGKNLMLGLFHGIKDHAHTAQNAFGAAVKFNPSLGVTQWGPLVRRALLMEGLNPLLAARVMYQIQTESGGNPNAINLTDSNAAAGTPSKGLLQVIGPTFSAYHWPGTSWNVYNPLANIAAALNYARHTYGPTLMRNGMGIGSGHGYEAGTPGAARGWAWVGERGPELVHMRGGETVLSHPQSMGIAGYAKGTHESLSERIDQAFAIIRHHPHLPELFHRLHKQLSRIVHRITGERQLIRLGHLHGEALHHAREELRDDEDRRRHVHRLLRPLAHNRNLVARAEQLLTVRDHHLVDALHEAQRRHMTRIASRIADRLTDNRGTTHRFTSWLDMAAIEAGRRHRREQREAAARAAVRERTAARAANDTTIRSYLGFYAAGWSPQAQATAAAALGVRGPVTFDAGGWLPPGVTMAVNQTGYPEQVIPGGSRGGGGVIVVKVDPVIAAATPDRRLGQHIAQQILMHTKGGGRLFPAGVAPK